MTPEHEGYCRKEQEIAEIHTKVKRMEKILLDGNGEQPLVTSVPKLSQEVERFNNETIPDLKKGMSGLLKYQQSQEGKDEGKSEMRRQNRWVIGTLVTLVGILLGAFITVLVVLL